MRCIAGRCPDGNKDRTAGKTAVCGRRSEGKTAWMDSSLQKKTAAGIGRQPAAGEYDNGYNTAVRGSGLQCISFLNFRYHDYDRIGFDLRSAEALPPADHDSFGVNASEWRKND